jgi:hypothetical protein
MAKFQRAVVMEKFSSNVLEGSLLYSFLFKTNETRFISLPKNKQGHKDRKHRAGILLGTLGGTTKPQEKGQITYT